MDNNDFWKRVFNEKRTHVYVWFGKTLNEVAIITHWLYHNLETHNETVFILTEQSENEQYSVIAVISADKLSQQSIMKYLKKVPHYENDSWTGGK